MSTIPSVIDYLYSFKKTEANVTVKIKVWGNCGKCKTRIENAVRLKGVKKAKWSITTKILTLTYSPKIISLEKIHEKLALKGHDTENLYAPKSKYQTLPECCRYRRE